MKIISITPLLYLGLISSVISAPAGPKKRGSLAKQASGLLLKAIINNADKAPGVIGAGARWAKDPANQQKIQLAKSLVESGVKQLASDPKNQERIAKARKVLGLRGLSGVSQSAANDKSKEEENDEEDDRI